MPVSAPCAAPNAAPFAAAEAARHGTAQRCPPRARIGRAPRRWSAQRGPARPARLSLPLPPCLRGTRRRRPSRHRSAAARSRIPRAAAKRPRQAAMMSAVRANRASSMVPRASNPECARRSRSRRSPAGTRPPPVEPRAIHPSRRTPRSVDRHQRTAARDVIAMRARAAVGMGRCHRLVQLPPGGELHFLLS